MRRLPMAAVAVLAVAGCSGASDRAPVDDTRPDEVVAVRVVLSGGITGGREVYDVRRDEVPSGMTPARRDRVLDLAGSLVSGAGGADRTATGCCDVRTVELRVRYDDGSRDRVAMAETELPAAASRLLAMVARGR